MEEGWLKTGPFYFLESMNDSNDKAKDKSSQSQSQNDLKEKDPIKQDHGFSSPRRSC